MRGKSNQFTICICDARQRLNVKTITFFTFFTFFIMFAFPTPHSYSYSLTQFSTVLYCFENLFVFVANDAFYYTLNRLKYRSLITTIKTETILVQMLFIVWRKNGKTEPYLGEILENENENEKNQNQIRAWIQRNTMKTNHSISECNDFKIIANVFVLLVYAFGFFEIQIPWDSFELDLFTFDRFWKSLKSFNNHKILWIYVKRNYSMHSLTNSQIVSFLSDTYHLKYSNEIHFSSIISKAKQSKA